MPRSPARLLALLLISAASGALAQSPPPRPPAPSAPADAAFDAQKAAFVALPLATRVAAQDALVWLGFYNGVSDGDFGKRTRDSIAAFQLAQKGKGDGVLTPGQLQALLAAGQKARAAVGFKTIDDPKTGARIGAPTKLFGAGGASLDFGSDAGGDLAALYARLSAESAARKITYKATKPGAFFVVSGQEGGRKFYTRYERSGGASPPIRGFVFAYPARADLDRVAIAVANSFVAFPQPGSDKTAAAASGASAEAGAPPAAPKPTATALIVAPGRAVTVLKPEDCPNPSVAGAPAKIERADAGTGLALLSGGFGAGVEAPKGGTRSPDLVVLSAGGGGVSATPAVSAADGGVVAALERSGAGGAVFDRSGGLAGLVGPIAEEPKRVGDAPLAAAHPLIDAEAIGGFLGGGALTPLASSPPLSVGEIAARAGASVAAVACGR